MNRKLYLFLQCLFLISVASINITNAQIRYIKPIATGSGNGSSWANASSNLQGTINASASGDEVWVAAGTFTPTLDATGSASPTDPRDKTFLLKTGVKLYGGFSGNEALLTDRPILSNGVITTLTGDFNNDDVISGIGSTLTITGNTENAYHVVLSSSNNSATLLDGFTLIRGNANHASSVARNAGGGIFFNSSSPTITNCIIRTNASSFGGGVNCYSSNPNFNNCVFYSNLSTGSGGGMYNNASSPVIKNCIFYGNKGTNSGGAMFNTYPNVFFPTAKPEAYNCIFTSNDGNAFGCIRNASSSIVTLKNCIVWNNVGGSFYNTATINVSYSCIDGTPLQTGVGNTNFDPLFTNPTNYDGNDNIWSTSDDGLQISCGSPCYNTGNNTSPTPVKDILGNAIFGTNKDMGAYESQINLSTTGPTATSPQTFVGVATIANLIVTGTSINWYAAATGGAPLISTLNLVNGSTYYASQTPLSCESVRTAVVVTINNPTVFYFKPSQTDLTLLANWGDNIDGTGNAPLNFTTNDYQFILTSSQTLNSTLTLGVGTIFQIGNGGTAAILYLTSNGLINTGTVNIVAASSGNNTLNTAAATTPILGTIAMGANGSTIAYTGTGVQTIANIVYNNLTVNNTNGISISNNLTVNDALILSNGKLDIGSNTLTLNGTFSGTATNSIKADGSSNLIVGGSGTMGGSLFFDQTTPGTSKGTGLANDLTLISQGTTNRFNNFTLNRAGSGTLTLGNEMQITNAFTPTAGTLASDGNLVMLSTETTTSSILTLGATAAITGNVNVQSFFKGGSYSYFRGYRMISSPIAEVASPGNFFKKMQERFIVTGPTGTGGGFDAGGTKVPNAITFRSYVETGDMGATSYALPNNISDLITVGKGYFFFFRGDRTNATTTKVNDVNSVFANPEDCTATYIGTVNTGDKAITVTRSSSGDGYDGYNLIGNPYPSTIDFDLLVAGNAVLSENIMSIINRNRTGFITRSGGVINSSTSPLPGADPDPGQNIRFIQPGQGFNVKATAGTVTFREAYKVTSAQIASSARVLSTQDKGGVSIDGIGGNKIQSQSVRQLIRLNVEDAVNQDAATVVLEPGNTANYGGNDAIYFGGSTVFCSTLTSDSIKTAINFMPALNEVREISINVSSNVSNANLKLNFTELTAIEGKLALLHDKYTNTFTRIDKSNSTYVFAIDKDVKQSFGDKRFVLELISKEDFSVQLGGFNVSKRVYGALISWSTNSEKNSDYFDIERSEDGIHFFKIKQQSAACLSSDKLSYTFSDKSTSAAINYYRLKMVDKDGKYDYSKVVSIDYSFSADITLSIYPNPVIDKLNVSWKTNDNNSKLINIFDITGRLVKAVVGSKENYVIQNVTNLPSGVYILKLVDQTNGKTIASSKFIKKN